MEENKNRLSIDYQLKELKIIQKEANILSEQIELKSLKGINIIYPNQKECGEQICKELKNDKIINVLVYGKLVA